ncbi:hypothetical protein C8R44DRAFT_20849 [Mycena epipterygia]|nr:hypothetical protein C8R44DRAFT_20849 [Mycena epipterygia]
MQSYDPPISLVSSGNRRCDRRPGPLGLDRPRSHRRPRPCARTRGGENWALWNAASEGDRSTGLLPPHCCGCGKRRGTRGHRCMRNSRPAFAPAVVPSALSVIFSIYPATATCAFAFRRSACTGCGIPWPDCFDVDAISGAWIRSPDGHQCESWHRAVAAPSGSSFVVGREREVPPSHILHPGSRCAVACNPGPSPPASPLRTLPPLGAVFPLV